MDKTYIIGQANIANDPTAVKFTPQSLTSEQKVQAQTNIGLNDIQLVKTNDLEYTLYVGGQDAGVINIPKDQFLKSVEFNPDTKILTFVFTTSTGDVTTTIDMSALIDVYTAGNGLLLVGNQFSINLDGNSNNSLTISADGLMLDKTQFASTTEFETLSDQVTDNAAQIETLNSNFVKSPATTGAFLNGQNTLANAQSSFTVESSTLADETAITVRKANKNLAFFNDGNAAIMSVSDNLFTVNGQDTSNYGFTETVYLGKGTYTITCVYVSGEVSNTTKNESVWIRVGNSTNPTEYSGFLVSKNFATTKIEGNTFSVADGEECLVRIYGTVSATYNNLKFTVQLEVSNTYTGYEKPVYEDITTAVGQSIDITQYDKVTNLSVLTEGAVVSGQFILSTQYELNDKLTPLFGTFATRPTTTQPYAILYIATDQTGENKVTILPANTDGSVSGNWISI